MLQKMFLAGAANLEAKKEYINELNVFPVPDGDTGTNMTLTIMSAAKEVSALENPDMVSISKAISSGSLRGARGNSGVILSQLLRGFTKEIREYQEIDAAVLARACDRATATAYKAVMKPKEGTILTVAKGAAQKAQEMAETTEDLELFLSEVIKYAEEVLAHVVDLHPGELSVCQRLLDRQARVVGMHMDFYHVLVRHTYDRITDRFQIRLKVGLILLCKLIFRHNDKLRAVSELDICLSLLRRPHHLSACACLDRCIIYFFSLECVKCAMEDFNQSLSAGIDYARLFQHREHLRRLRENFFCIFDDF